MEAVRRYRRGMVLIQVVLMLVALLGFVALTTDYGLMVVRQRRLQNVTDAAALAAGPDLRKADNTPINDAKLYAGYNGVAAVETANPHIDAPTVANAAITVHASENVPTPFAAVMNSAWSTRPVSATSVVQAILAVDAKDIRPLAASSGPFGPSGVGKFLNLEMDLSLNNNGNGKGYDDSPANGSSSPVSIVPIDLPDSGSVNDYKNALKFGMSGNLQYDQKGGKYWIASMMFDSGKDWANNLVLWRNATYEAIVSDSDSIMKRVGPGTPYYGDTYDHFTVGDPRFVVLLEINRITGGGNKNFDAGLQGYVGFFIEGMSSDKSLIHGRFIEPVKKCHTLTTSSTLPPVDNLGLYSFNLIQ